MWCAYVTKISEYSHPNYLIAESWNSITRTLQFSYRYSRFFQRMPADKVNKIEDESRKWFIRDRRIIEKDKKDNIFLR